MQPHTARLSPHIVNASFTFSVDTLHSIEAAMGRSVGHYFKEWRSGSAPPQSFIHTLHLCSYPPDEESKRPWCCLKQAWPMSPSPSPSNSVSIPASPASRSVSDVCAIWSGSTSVDILVQSRDSGSLCAARLCSEAPAVASNTRLKREAH